MSKWNDFCNGVSKTTKSTADKTKRIANMTSLKVKLGNLEDKVSEEYDTLGRIYYSQEVGKTFRIIFDNGNDILVIVGDIKADSHTDPEHKYTAVYDSSGNFISANVLEFVVDTNKISRKAKRMGSVGVYKMLQGNIASITEIGKGEVSDEKIVEAEV